MLITRYFAFLHVRKTGGTFLEQVCRDHLPAEWIVPNRWDPHATIRQIPAEYGELPVFAAVRNPWDWYVSWYHHTRQRARAEADYQEGSDWRWAFDSGRATFKQAVSALCCQPIESSNPAGEPAWVAKARAHDWDLYSHWCHIVLQDGPATGRVEIAHYEQLTSDFLNFLERHAVPITDGFAKALGTAPRVNASEHGPHRDYYDAELRELVGRKCRGIVEAYGYEF